MEIIEKIRKLKEEKNALILAHYYAPLELWEIADAVGDSLELSRRAAAAEEDLIVFCGVRFMAESAKILNPKKKVLLPVADAGCPMADMIEKEALVELKKKYPKAAVICYVNSSAEVKAESDICCTSSNAVKVAGSLDAEEILFVPDKNLGSYVASQYPQKKFHFIEGYCPIHNACSAEDLKAARLRHPNALVAAHPECAQGSAEVADFVGSTTGILNFCRESQGEEFIIGTETEIVRALKKELPHKKFYPAKEAFLCEDMKKNSLSALLNALETEENEILLDPAVLERAKNALEKMICL